MTTPTETTLTPDRLRVDFLFVDRTTCTRCRGADDSPDSAFELVCDVLAATGIDVEVEKIQVESAEQARELRFVSSPTIRLNGHDVALELRESSCGSEACTDGCGEEIACRVWVHRGREYTQPPVAMIVDAILRAVYAGAVVSCQPEAEPYEFPENLERCFAGKAMAQTAEAACCPPAEQRSCCEPEDKADCCGDSSGEGCGCR
jgi:hypothetical protein